MQANLRASLRWLTVVFLFLSPVLAQLQWRMNPSQGPTPRNSYAIAYDPVRGETVMFGGVQGNTFFDETWILDARGWRLASPGIKPLARTGAAMAYCGVLQSLILFGGADRNGGVFGDTWSWDGAWVQLMPGTSPSPRVGHAMTSYRPPERSVVLFGGSPDGGGVNWRDLWAWNGSTWRGVEAPVSPQARPVSATTWKRPTTKSAGAS
jgi:hypothetical protein